MSLPKHLVLYDGECGFCNHTVQWLLARDRNEVLYFAPLQGDIAGQLMPQLELPADLDSIIYVRNTSEQLEAFIHSTAALEIVRVLPTPWSWLRLFIVTPSVIRDGLYKAFAKRRIRWFGRVDACDLPTESQSQRMLS